MDEILEYWLPKICWRMRDELTARPGALPGEKEHVLNKWAAESPGGTFI